MLSSFKTEQPWNIVPISVTLEVLKLETLSSSKLEQTANIPLMLVTLEVLKLERFRDVNLEQPSNILLIFVTLEVLKLERFRFVKLEQCENIALISFTSEVLRFSSPSIVVSALRLENQDLVVVGRKFLNEASNTTFVTALLEESVVPIHLGCEESKSFFSLMPQVSPLCQSR